MLRTGSVCSSSGPCSGPAAGGPTTLSVNFIPDNADGDGFPDTLDSCPNESGPSSTNGCPDRDGDGVADSSDACPDAGGAAALGGCPDGDGDGVRDIDDACPSVAGPAENRGCPTGGGVDPDGDGDGVRDRDDRCPTVPGLAANQGCPSTSASNRDGDSLIDADDRCPDTKGTAADGCPDTDGDGKSDRVDKCPRVQGTGDNGCPKRIAVSFPYGSDAYTSRTVFYRLKVTAPVGARVYLSCTGRCRLTGNRRSMSFIARQRTTNLLTRLKTRSLTPGTRISIRVTYPQSIGRSRTYVVRRGAPPRKLQGCVSATGAPTRCG
jgi:hypothetical protein